PKSPYSTSKRSPRTREAGQRAMEETTARERTAARAIVSARAADRVRGGHPWVYRSDVERVQGAAPGSVLAVEDQRGKLLGYALYSSSSQISLRMLGTDPRAQDLPAFVRERLKAAIEYRRQIVRDSNAYRVVFSEADFVPGLIVDRYNDLLSFQVLTQAMDDAAVREAVIETLVEELAPAGILEKVEPRIRELEELPAREEQLVYSADGERTSTTFEMNGIQFRFDGLGGQKTGAFLDQRQNYLATERYARGRALDICTYQGGFALYLNRACEHVTAVDVSRAALEVAEQNEKLNAEQYDGREIEWMEANAFDLLRDYSDRGEKFETIVLDPPAFAKSKKNIETAVRGYKEMNLRALKMLRYGGTLVTCSCSFHVQEPEFLEMLSAAALDSHRRVRILEKRTQSQDHPILLNVPETYYLKCIICTVS
ncbi:MAG TPA: class I SAM-dependent rRNA methyltransferase, partial [candidate division Zixibacteria bacterium]|nr:class I SAM-dependent rRNA methyltransferase [candidate division Zixibacteria bacterium]